MSSQYIYVVIREDDVTEVGGYRHVCAVCSSHQRAEQAAAAFTDDLDTPEIEAWALDDWSRAKA